MANAEADTCSRISTLRSRGGGMAALVIGMVGGCACF